VTIAKYVYKGQNLTTLVLGKIEHVVGLVAERAGSSFEESYREFLMSRTYRNLTDPETLLWSESAEFIVDDYDRECATQAASVESASAP
jgi:hypothetical protein